MKGGHYSKQRLPQGKAKHRDNTQSEEKASGVKGQHLRIVSISSSVFIEPSKALMRESVSWAMATKF